MTQSFSQLVRSHSICIYTVLGTSNTKLFCKFVKALHFTSILCVHSSMCDHVCMLNIVRRPPPSGRVQCDSVSLLWPVHHQLAGSRESESEGRVIPRTLPLSQDGVAELCHCGASPADILLTAYTQERGLCLTKLLLVLVVRASQF